jgi:hypothetical protein
VILHRRERYFPVVLPVGDHGTRFAPNYSPQRDRASNRRLDPPTAARSYTFGPYLPLYPPPRCNLFARIVKNRIEKIVEVPNVIAEHVAPRLGVPYLVADLLRLLDIISSVVGMREISCPEEAIAFACCYIRRPAQ